jgi:hypothetical protein
MLPGAAVCIADVLDAALQFLLAARFEQYPIQIMLERGRLLHALEDLI